MEKICNIIIIIYISFKLACMFIFEHDNFFLKINVRIDSPSYIIRNHYRSYIENWSEKDARIKEMVSMKDKSSDLSQFHDMDIYKTFSKMEFLSDQLKIKEKKAFYSKFGEHAFLNCAYCTTDTDFLLYLIPFALAEYSLFLVLVGFLSSKSSKANWRIYGLIVGILSAAIEIYSHFKNSQTTFELYDSIFGEDFFTLRYEKTKYVREIAFVLFLTISLVVDNGKDLRLRNSFDQIQKSLETSLAFLQTSRIQKAAIATDETLQKFLTESTKKNSKLASIIADPGFRQKVLESGRKLKFEELLQQKDETIEKLMELVKNN